MSPLRGGVLLEIAQIQSEGAVIRSSEHPPNRVLENGLPVGCQPHHLVLALVHRKAEVSGESGIEHAQGVRESDFAEQRQLTAAVAASAAANRQRCPFADSIRSEDGGLAGGGSEERGRRVGVMMLGE